MSAAYQRICLDCDQPFAERGLDALGLTCRRIADEAAAKHVVCDRCSGPKRPGYQPWCDPCRDEDAVAANRRYGSN